MSSGSVRVHLVRHGQSTWNLAGRLQGQTAHPPLTPLGRIQADAAARAVAARVQQEITLWSSDLARALETAAIIASRLGVFVRTDEALREQALGQLQGRLTAELHAEPTPAGQHIAEVRWAGGESVRDVHERVGTFLRRVLPTAPQDLVLVSHGDTIRVLCAWFEGRSHRDVDWEIPIENGSVTTLVWRSD